MLTETLCSRTMLVIERSAVKALKTFNLEALEIEPQKGQAG